MTDVLDTIAPWLRAQYPTATLMQSEEWKHWSTGTHRLDLVKVRVDRGEATLFIVAQDLHPVEPVVNSVSRPFTVSEVAHVLCNLTAEELANLVTRTRETQDDHPSGPSKYGEDDTIDALKAAGIEADDPVQGVRELAAQRDATQAHLGRINDLAERYATWGDKSDMRHRMPDHSALLETIAREIHECQEVEDDYPDEHPEEWQPAQPPSDKTPAEPACMLPPWGNASDPHPLHEPAEAEPSAPDMRELADDVRVAIRAWETRTGERAPHRSEMATLLAAWERPDAPRTPETAEPAPARDETTYTNGLGEKWPWWVSVTGDGEHLLELSDDGCDFAHGADWAELQSDGSEQVRTHKQAFADAKRLDAEIRRRHLAAAQETIGRLTEELERERDIAEQNDRSYCVARDALELTRTELENLRATMRAVVNREAP